MILRSHAEGDSFDAYRDVWQFVRPTFDNCSDTTCDGNRSYYDCPDCGIGHSWRWRMAMHPQKKGDAIADIEAGYRKGMNWVCKQKGQCCANECQPRLPPRKCKDICVHAAFTMVSTYGFEYHSSDGNGVFGFLFLDFDKTNGGVYGCDANIGSRIATGLSVALLDTFTFGLAGQVQNVVCGGQKFAAARSDGVASAAPSSNATHAVFAESDGTHTVVERASMTKVTAAQLTAQFTALMDRQKATQ